MGILVLMEYVEPGQAMKAIEPSNTNVLRLFFYNKYADNPKIGQAYLTLALGQVESFDEDSVSAMGNVENLDSGSDDKSNDSFLKSTLTTMLSAVSLWKMNTPSQQAASHLELKEESSFL